MATKTSLRRQVRRTRDQIVRCDQALALALGLPVKPATEQRK